MLSLPNNFESHIAPLLADTPKTIAELAARIAQLDSLRPRSFNETEADAIKDTVPSAGVALKKAVAWFDQKNNPQQQPQQEEGSPATSSSAFLEQILPTIFAAARKLPDAVAEFNARSRAAISDPPLPGATPFSAFPASTSATPLPNGNGAAVTMELPARVVHCLLCAGFLCCPPEPPRPSSREQARADFSVTDPDTGVASPLVYGDLSLRRLHAGTPVNIAAEKLKCYIYYFSTFTEEGDRCLRIARSFYPRDKDYVLGYSFGDVHLSHMSQADVPAHHRATTGDGGEASPISTLVFGNSSPGFGVVIPSVTQEELMLLRAPELTVLCLFHSMRREEGIAVRGARLPCGAVHSGYGDSYSFDAAAAAAASVSVSTRNEEQAASDERQWTAEGSPELFIFADALVVDGGYAQQFSTQSVKRNLQKLTAGLKAAIDLFTSNDGDALYGRGFALSGGLWGCGVFGGDPFVSFIEQLIATTAGGWDRLYFSTFGNDVLLKSLELFMKGLLEKKIILETLAKWFFEFVANESASLPASVDPTRISPFQAAALKFAGVGEEQITELNAEVAAQNKAKSKLCVGCGWDLGATNPKTMCSACEKRKAVDSN